MVDFDVALVIVVVVLWIQQEIVGDARPAWKWIQPEITLHDRVKPRRGNAVTGEGIANAGACRVASRGIRVENRGYAIESPSSQIGGWHSENTRKALTDSSALIVGEEEGAVMAVVKAGQGDRTARGAAELVLLKWRKRPAAVEEIISIERVVAQKLERDAVEFVCS